MKRVLVAADDITGADDIGLMYYNSSHPSVLYPFPSAQQACFGDCSKLVVDTDSRFVKPDEAYRRVYEVVRRFAGQADQFFSKQCSVFRGNIGAEFDAMLDATGEPFAPVVLGFPDNGRTTLDGIHYVYGVKLEESQFRNDPVNPMRESDLVKILSAQTKRPVCSVSWREYEKSDESLVRILQEKKKQGGYAIFDVRNNRDLERLAAVLENERVICGSSAIAYYLGMRETAEANAEGLETSRAGEKVLCLAGSLTPQTAAQIAFAETTGCPVLTLGTTELFDSARREKEMERLREAYREHRNSEMVVLRTCSEPGQIRRTKELAAEQGISAPAAATAVSDALAGLAYALAQEDGVRNIIVCGGDTSASFCRRFQVGGMRVGPQIEPGVSVCTSLERSDLRFVLKSGSFGSETFLEKAKNKLLQGGHNHAV